MGRNAHVTHSVGRSRAGRNPGGRLRRLRHRPGPRQAQRPGDRPRRLCGGQHRHPQRAPGARFVRRSEGAGVRRADDQRPRGGQRRGTCLAPKVEGRAAGQRLQPDPDEGCQGHLGQDGEALRQGVRQELRRQRARLSPDRQQGGRRRLHPECREWRAEDPAGLRAQRPSRRTRSTPSRWWRISDRDTRHLGRRLGGVEPALLFHRLLDGAVRPAGAGGGRRPSRSISSSSRPPRSKSPRAPR